MSKKFILFIVEGDNDKREINAILHTECFSRFFERYEPILWPTNGDITTASGASASNIQKKLNSILLDFRKNGVPWGNIKPTDIHEIVQIVDLDGAFIPPDNILPSEDNAFEYHDDHILTSNVDGAVGRNRKKAEVLNKLISIDKIGDVNYSVYFVSCNMDHVLFGNRSLSRQEKGFLSREFQLKCERDQNVLNESLFNPDVAANGSYYESWYEIQEDTLSLQRYTNFNLFFGEEAKNAK